MSDRSDQTDRNAALRERTKAYASRIIRLYTYVQQHHRFDDPAMVSGKQLAALRHFSCAHHREAKHTRSRADRVAKVQIVLQELAERALWLELLDEHQMADTTGLHQLIDVTNQLIGIFVTSIKTVSGHQNPE